MNFFKSRTNWTIAGLFVVSGLEATQSQITTIYPKSAVVISFILAALGMYFRTHPQQQF